MPGTAVAASAVPVDLAGPPMQVGSTFLYFDGTTLVAVPGGPFTMGHGGVDDPVHTVTLSDFWIYSTKVTNQQYALCVKSGQCTPPDLNKNPAYNDISRFDDPVVGVDWTQAQAYCTYVHGNLPTEAQWEKAARGPNANIYPWGNNNPSCDLLNFNNCVGQTTDVTKYPQGKSYYDALDMEGNSYEWVTDWFDELYYKTGPAQDPLGPDKGNVRSVRSSSYKSTSDQAPAATRFYADPTSHRNDLGFRCVVIDPTFFAPLCQVTALFGNNLSGNPGPATGKPDCPVVTISSQAFGCGESGYTVVKATDDKANDPNVPPAQVSGLTDPPCQLTSAPGTWPQKYQCTNVKTSFKATITGQCYFPTAVNASCPAHYKLDTATDTCVWDGSGTSGTQCPAGTQYDSVNKCCTATQGTASNFSACPVGTVFQNVGKGVYECLPAQNGGWVIPGSAPIDPSPVCSTNTGGSCPPITCQISGEVVNPATCTCYCPKPGSCG